MQDYGEQYAQRVVEFSSNAARPDKPVVQGEF